MSWHVWIVMHRGGWNESDHILGVFATQDAAERVRKELSQSTLPTARVWEAAGIEEWPVQS